MSDLKANIVCVYVVSSQASLKEENNRKYQRKKRCKERPSRPLPCLYVKRPQTTRGINHFHLFSNNDLLWDTGNMHAPTLTHSVYVTLASGFNNWGRYITGRNTFEFSSSPKGDLHKFSSPSAVVTALASHQRGPGSNLGVDIIFWLILLLVLSLAPRGFSPGTPVFPPSSKTNISKFRFPSKIIIYLHISQDERWRDFIK